MEKLQLKVEGIEEEQKEIDQRWAKLQMKRVSFMIKIQNIPEDLQEDLSLLVSETLAPLIALDVEGLQNEKDQIYRVTSNYAKKKKKTPREVHIRFRKRHIRDMILREKTDYKRQRDMNFERDPLGH